ncbi:MAG: CDGSH iron-sulfur domain-containing protein [Candidatus Sericytochromatia bacterium]|nr:CDGSH iron-sulfur domain-containing protein [Candidatus Sericytochromatia bacterium]
MTTPEIPQKAPYVLDMEPGSYFWCACGKSQNQPYCDGSHAGSGLRPVRAEITESKKVAWCGCKQSENKPFCDGNHRKLP